MRTPQEYTPPGVRPPPEEYLLPGRSTPGAVLTKRFWPVQYGSGQYGAKLVLTKQFGRYSTRTAPANRTVGGRFGTYARNLACLFSIADSQLCVQTRIHSHLLYLTQFGGTAVSLMPGTEYGP